MTIKIEDLEFGSMLGENGEILIKIIHGPEDEPYCTFLDVEELKAAIKFLETEVNR